MKKTKNLALYNVFIQLCLVTTMFIIPALYF